MFPCSHTLSECFRTVIFRNVVPCSQKLANVPLFPWIFCQCSLVPPNPWETLLCGEREKIMATFVFCIFNSLPGSLNKHYYRSSNKDKSLASLHILKIGFLFVYCVIVKAVKRVGIISRMKCSINQRASFAYQAINQILTYARSRLTGSDISLVSMKRHCIFQRTVVLFIAPGHAAIILITHGCTLS